jgi:CubicO group peptidase (beta-lactamase class C family)
LTEKHSFRIINLRKPLRVLFDFFFIFNTMHERCDFMKKFFAFLTVLALVSVTFGCTPKMAVLNTAEAPQTTAPSPDKRPYWPTAEWQTTPPEEQGMDVHALEQITAYVRDSGLPVDSVIVVRHGYIVYEKYFGAQWDVNTVHNIFSCTKSIMGSLVGIALQHGKISSLDDRMVDYFPNRTIRNLNERKKAIRLIDLMTMKGGFDWPERSYPYTDPRNPWIRALRSNDTVQFVLDAPMAAEPGTVWGYNGGFSQLLSAIVTDKTGMNTMEFAKENLFGPLGITKFIWKTDQQGIYDAGGGLSMTPRDMAKYGYLILNRGVWEGKQIIPADFVAESVKTQTLFNAHSGYGYESWWTIPPYGYYYAAGIRGQRIYVMEKQDMVIVTTANLPEDSQTGMKMLKIAQYAVSACK